MSIKDKYIVREISKKDAQDIIVKEHYLHRKAPCSYCYGLVNKTIRTLQRFKGI